MVLTGEMRLGNDPSHADRLSIPYTMKQTFSKITLSAMLATGALTLCQCGGPVTQINAANVNSRQLAANSRSALNQLYSNNAEARKLGARARGVLVFPEVTKGGFMVGGFGGMEL
jgi:hypothetical protein